MAIDAHPELPEFDYIRPTSWSEASSFLAQHPGEARPLLGGTDIFVRMRDGFWHDKYLVDLKNLEGARDLHFDPESGLILGAAMNMNRVMSAPAVQQHYPLLVEAIHWVASYQLRSRATIVGNLCNASPAGDTTGACMVYNGRLRVHGVDGYRWEPLSKFFTGPGKTVLMPGDIVTALHLPPPPPGSAGTYIKLGRNRLSDLAIVGVTALGFSDSSAPSGCRFRIALAAVAPVPLVPVEAETFLAYNPPGKDAFSKAARLAQDAAQPIDDVRGSARYRKAMVRSLTFKALNTILGKLQG